jgi:hypothetical protein
MSSVASLLHARSSGAQLTARMLASFGQRSNRLFGLDKHFLKVRFFSDYEELLSIISLPPP